MDQPEMPDRPLARALEQAAPRAPFPREALEARIAATVDGLALSGAAPARRRRWPRRLLRWGTQVAAALLLVAGGAAVGRFTAGTGAAFTGSVVGEPAAGHLLIDLTAARDLGPTGLDAGLGMTLRCDGCEVVILSGAAQWTIPEYPVVQSVVPGGVAEEAGLQPGDRILTVDGQDVRTRAGVTPLNALPVLDFTIGFRRGDQMSSAAINRRITNQVVISEGVRVQPSPPRGLRGKIGDFLVFLGRLIGGRDPATAVP